MLSQASFVRVLKIPGGRCPFRVSSASQPRDAEELLTGYDLEILEGKGYVEAWLGYR